MGELEDEVFLVMLGFSNPDTFGVRLAQELHLAPEKGRAVAADVSNQIFLPIRESMKKFAEEQRGGTAPAKSVIMPSAQAAADTKPTMMPPLPLKVLIPPSTPAVQMPKPPAPPPQKPEMHSAEMMLREKTVSAPAPTIPPPPFVPKPPVPLASPVAPTKPVPPKPTDYKADPYREPIEP